VIATNTIAAKLGTKLPAIISSVASQGSCGRMAGDSAQHAQDQANVSATYPSSGERCSRARSVMAGTRSAAS
jgi:hypothetical protein